MNAGQFIYIGGGRVRTTALGKPNRRGPNAVPFIADGAICVRVGGAITHHVSGLPYNADGAIVVQTNLGMPIGSYVAGLAITTAGRLACDTSGAIHHYVRGIPVTATGRVCIDLPAAEPQEDEEEP